jgi:hypothetical protein
MEQVYYVWDRPVHLETWLDREKIIFTYDGRNHTKYHAG